MRGGSVLYGNCSPRLASRLGSGSAARLLTLGKDLQGQTIAAEAVGSAACLPLASDTFLLVIRGLEQEALDQADLERLARLSAEVAPYFQSNEDEPLHSLVGQSPVMQQLRKRLKRLGSVDSTVLISGNSGTGKELIANCLHNISGRRDAPFIALNCAAVAASLFEAELFGHEKGAFSGADIARQGAFVPPMEAPYFSMKSVNYLSNYRLNYCGSCKKARLSPLALPSPLKSMCA